MSAPPDTITHTRPWCHHNSTIVLIVPSYLWMECPQRLVETCNSNHLNTSSDEKSHRGLLQQILTGTIIDSTLPHISIESVVVLILLQISGFRRETSDSKARKAHALNSPIDLKKHGGSLELSARYIYTVAVPRFFPLPLASYNMCLVPLLVRNVDRHCSYMPKVGASSLMTECDNERDLAVPDL